MERCPNCGQLSRLGAKFCTICGQKLSGEEGKAGATAVGTAPAPQVQVQMHVTEEPTADGNASPDAVSGWPAAPPADEAPADLAWVPPANGAVVAEPSETGEAVNGEAWPSIWSTEGSATWPAPPTSPEPVLEASSPAPEESEPATELELEAETDAAEQALAEDAVDVTAEAGQSARARDRATQLLDELRETIATLSGEAPRDLSGVISELEVAVTPPGAIGAEELSELREALLKARERPRDLDTVVDLTGRVDALVALVIAYDRTIAAIERSLDVLKGDG